MPSNVGTIALVSVVVALLVLGLKTLAYLATGSVALLSDALESVVNLGTALAALLAVRLAARPASAALPYGYGKAEYLSAVAEGVLILVAAGLIAREAYFGLLSPRALEAPWQGLALNLLATALNGAWSAVLLRTGRERSSPALVADGQHLLTDVVSSIGVVLGVALAAVTGWAWLDPLLAVLVAVFILVSGWRLVADSVGGLMDVAVPADELARIRTLISTNAEGAIEAHDIRTRRAGAVTFIDFHLVVPGTMSVAAAHAICDRIEAELHRAVEAAQITIHVEPEEKAKHTGIVVL